MKTTAQPAIWRLMLLFPMVVVRNLYTTLSAPKTDRFPACPHCGRTEGWIVTRMAVIRLGWPEYSNADTRDLRCPACGYRARVAFFEKGRAGFRKPAGWSFR